MRDLVRALGPCFALPDRAAACVRAIAACPPYAIALEELANRFGAAALVELAAREVLDVDEQGRAALATLELEASGSNGQEGRS